MEGLTASELSMIKKLAGNDGLARKKTMKKLKTWLTAIAARAPDTADCRTLLEPNFLRVWKALFYCMWMADKPMPQEQLADQISSLVEVFDSKPNVLNLFVEWFFRTMAREWQYIDRFRLDKFSMLVRRFLRKVLTVLEINKWKLELLDGFLRILSVNVFNRRPELKATRASVRVPGIEVAPVGLQTHILDIFMEELAKVGGNTLKNKKILKILTPFIYELCNNDDDRIITELQERIFRHLMRQSDAGIDYAEGISSEDGVYDDENEENVSDEEDEDADEEDRLLDEELENMGPLDPRAGNVDVILPQLKVDYGELAEKLVQAGGQKSVRPKNRKIAYSLAKQFKEISAGQYPLAIKLDEDKSPAIKNTDIDKAARRLLNFEEALTGPEKKMRKSKKARKKLAKKIAANDLDTSETNGSESDNANSFYLEDNELLDHVGDNYMSYLEELHQKEAAKTNGVQNGQGDLDTDEDAEEEEEEEMPIKTKRRRLSQLTNGTPDHNTENKDNLTPLRKTLKQRKSLNIELSTNEASPAAPKKKIMKKRMSLPAVVTNSVSENADEESIINNDDDTVVANGNGDVHILLREKPKKRKQSPKAAIKAEAAHTPSSPSTTKKRVSFVLARNLHHEHSDYQQSINRSPAIPYDSGKQPVTGLLKSPKSPAPGASYFSNGLQSTPRRKSGRF